MQILMRVPAVALNKVMPGSLFYPFSIFLYVACFRNKANELEIIIHYVSLKCIHFPSILECAKTSD